MKLLDCTLRDGGYYTNWDFDRELVDTYIRSFNHLPVDYLEIGYRSNPQPEYLGEYFYCPVYVMERIRGESNKKLAIILNEKDVKKEDVGSLLAPCSSLIDLIRIAVDPANFERALGLGKAIKKMGFEVSFNLMYMSDWETYPGLFDLMKETEGVVDYLYLVDSFGGVYPDDIRKTIKRVRDKTDTKLGFHGHNNLEMALSNTLTAIEEGVDIVDSTVTGMGRGAGNLKTELLLSVLHSKGIVEFDYNQLSKVTDPFQQLQKNFGWGTNLPYIVSGANSIPQKQVMEWVTRRYFSINSIIRALSNKSKGIKDNQKLQQLDISVKQKFDAALIVGGGPSAPDHADAIVEFLKRNSGTIIIHASSKNAMVFNDLSNKQIFCLVGNEGHRLERVFGSVRELDNICVLPPYPRTMGTYIPRALEKNAYELDEIVFTDRLHEAHTTIAIQTAIELGIEQIYVTGYDGYSGGSITVREQELFRENEYTFKKAKEHGIQLQSITPTKYEQLQPASVYAGL
jgi:4-hydroxy 2-oxovalerate aldolase